MNVKYINPLLESTIHVLQTMAFVQVTPGKPQLKNQGLEQGDVTGIIDLNGKGIVGWLAVSFAQPTIFDIVQKMVGDEPTGIDESVLDCVGEITNMITGAAKRKYSEQGLEIDLAIPRVFVDAKDAFANLPQGRSVVMPFNTAAGGLNVEFFFK